MKKLTLRKVEEFSQVHTDNKWRMGVEAGLTAKACVISTVSYCFTRKSDFFSRSLHKGGSSSRESENNKDAASGLVSLVGPACWPESKDSMLWVFCWWSRCICFFLWLHLFISSLWASLSFPSVPREIWAVGLYHTLGSGDLTGPDSVHVLSHDFIFVWGPIFTWL